MRKEQVLLPLLRNVVQRPRLASAFFRFDRWGNPFTDEIARDPYPSYDVIRAEGPVTYRALYQQWFVSGYDEIKAVLAAEQVAVGAQIETLMVTRPYSKLSDQAAFLFRHFLLVIDPPDHGRLRGLVAKAFTPRRVTALESRVEAIADDLLAELRGQGQPVWEMVESFNVKLPVNVIADLLGLPPERWEWARRTTTELVRLLDPFEGFDAAEVNAAVAEVFDVYGVMADDRRARPADDLLTALVEVEQDGDRLTRDELVVMVAFLMGAGFETTSNLLGNAIMALAAHPEERDKLCRHPELWPNAVEELIRYDTSIRRDPRHTTSDLTIGEVTIPAGSNVLLMLDAANRDPRHYDNPDRLQLDRADPRPISFGHGIHYCLGANLARMELRVGLQALLAAAGDYTVDPEAVTWKRSATLRGPTRLPLRPSR
jgi:cytochrome P450